MVMTLVLAGCSGTNYFDAGLSGRVIDRDDGQGINEAVVTLYTADPTDDAPYLLRSATLANNNSNGYYSFDKFLWENPSPMFGDVADRGRVWLVVTHPDYLSVTTWTDIISDTNIIIPEIELTRYYYYGTVQGRILDRDTDELLQGAQVRLFSADDPSTTLFTRATDNNGQYSFSDFRWPALNIASGSQASTSILLITSMDDYYNASTDGVQTVWSDQINIMPDIDMESDYYQASIRGRLVDDVTGDPVNDATVDLYIPQDSQDADYSDTSAQDPQTGQQGTFIIEDIFWDEDTSPKEVPVQTEPCKLEISAGGYADKQYPFIIESGHTPYFETGTIALTWTKTSFSGGIQGYIRDIPNNADTGINGVRVVVSVMDASQSNETSTTSTYFINDQTLQSGYYSIPVITWSLDSSPLPGSVPPYRIGTECAAMLSVSTYLDSIGATSWQALSITSGEITTLPDIDPIP